MAATAPQTSPLEAKLRVAEIFHSLQGEGIWMGIPSTFIRVSGCNLRCTWCDTPYASWRPEGPVMSISQVLEQVWEASLGHVVLTGGEPMLFDAIEPLALALRGLDKTITIETAGTIYRDLPCDLMSISPKLANSKPSGTDWAERHERIRLDRSPLTALIERYPNLQLKFVVNPELDGELEEIEALLNGLPAVPKDRILLMAEGVDSATLTRRQRMLVQPCIQRGWRLAPRMHVDLFGNTRGT